MSSRQRGKEGPLARALPPPGMFTALPIVTNGLSRALVGFESFDQYLEISGECFNDHCYRGAESMVIKSQIGRDGEMAQ